MCLMERLLFTGFSVKLHSAITGSGQQRRRIKYANSVFIVPYITFCLTLLGIFGTSAWIGAYIKMG